VVPLPANIKPGQYLFRHEIIALHGTPITGTPELYASCTQIKIGGSGTGEPGPDELVRFPGAYQDSDPGISDKDVNFSSYYRQRRVLEVGFRPHRSTVKWSMRCLVLRSPPSSRAG
jgi:hypothetical protein